MNLSLLFFPLFFLLWLLLQMLFSVISFLLSLCFIYILLLPLIFSFCFLPFSLSPTTFSPQSSLPPPLFLSPLFFISPPPHTLHLTQPFALIFFLLSSCFLSSSFPSLVLFVSSLFNHQNLFISSTASTQQDPKCQYQVTCPVSSRLEYQIL